MKPKVMSKRAQKTLLLVASISILVLSGYLFHRAYQLWSTYEEALDSYKRMRESKPFPISIFRPPYVFYAERYANFFIPRIVEGPISLIIAVTLIIHVLERLTKSVALTIVVIALVVGSIHSFYNTYQIWHRYQEATLDFYTSTSIPYVFYVDDYEKFFIPYVIVGAVSLIVATTLLLRRKTL